MKCPYCNNELGEKNECITSQCYAFGKIFPKYDSEKEVHESYTFSTLSKSKEKEINSEEANYNFDIDSKLEEIKKNATFEQNNIQNTSEDDSSIKSSDAGLYIFITLILLFVIGFNFF